MNEADARSELYQRRIGALAQLALVEHATDLQVLLATVAEQVKALLPAGGASIVLWDDERQQFVDGASTLSGQPRNMVQQRVRTHAGATRWILENGPLAVADVIDDPFGANPMLDEYALRSYIGVPISAGADNFGVLYGLCTETRLYSKSDVDFLILLAGRAGSAILVARLLNKIRQVATIDGLTGLLRRGEFYTRAADAIESARAAGTGLLMVLLDVDDLKRINDEFGHSAGDQALVTVADCLRSQVPPGAVSGRYAGDEFVSLISESDQAERFDLGRLQQALGQITIQVQDRQIPVSASIGVACLQPEDSAVDQLIQRADAAMYQMKSRRRLQRPTPFNRTNQSRN